MIYMLDLGVDIFAKVKRALVLTFPFGVKVQALQHFNIPNK